MICEPEYKSDDTPAKFIDRAELGKALIEALGLPKNTISVELRLAPFELVTVRCTYLPEISGEKLNSLWPELRKLKLREVPPGE